MVVTITTPPLLNVDVNVDVTSWLSVLDGEEVGLLVIGLDVPGRIRQYMRERHNRALQQTLKEIKCKNHR